MAFYFKEVTCAYLAGGDARAITGVWDFLKSEIFNAFLNNGHKPLSRLATMRSVMVEDYRYLVYTRIRDGRWYVRVDRVLSDRVDFYTEIEAL
jgi:hypothetical protein